MISELCVAQVLLIGAGLLIRSSIAVQSVPVGFETHNLLAFDIALPHARYENDARIDATFLRIDAALKSIPGVKSVGRTQVAPIERTGWSWTAFREGSNSHDDGAVGSNMRYVSPGYFATLGLPADSRARLHSGRRPQRASSGDRFARVGEADSGATPIRSDIASAMETSSIRGGARSLASSPTCTRTDSPASRRWSCTNRAVRT